MTVPAARPATRTRPADGNQAYVSDFRAQRTPITFVRFFNSTQRAGTFVAAITEASGRERFLQLDDAADVALFRDKLMPGCAIEIQGVGHDVRSQKLLVWLDGERVDAHEFLAPSTTGAPPVPVVDWPALRRTYGLAFESALQVRDALELPRDQEEFDVNAAAAALFHRAMTLQSVARKPGPREQG